MDLIPGSVLMCGTKSKTPHHNDEMDTEHFRKLMKNQLISGLPPGVIAVVDNTQ
jgi:hypothetical protein